MPVGLFGEVRNTTSGAVARTRSATSNGSRVKSSRRPPSTQAVPDVAVMIGCIEYDGVNPSAVRPGPPNAWSSCWSTSLEPFAAHTCPGCTGCPVDALR